MENIAEKLAGRFIIIDGPDGAGKSTHLEMLAEWVRNQGMPVVKVADPGTTAIGEKIRAILLDRDNCHMSPMCETLLFMASRAQLINEIVSPAIEQGKVVLCDRFVSATLAYQGASGVDGDTIINLAETAIQGRWPDLTVILNLSADEGMKRLGVFRGRLKKTAEEKLKQMHLFGDRMEIRESDYHNRVRRIFMDIDELYPAAVTYVDAAGTIEEVFRKVTDAIVKAFDR